MSTRPRCRNCPNRSFRPRGLCERCYWNPAIRAAFPSTSKFARRTAQEVADPTPEEIRAAAEEIRRNRTRKQWDDL